MTNDKPIQLDRVTRVEIIDSTGRAFVGYYEPGIEIHLQDDQQTVKIFAGERGPVPQGMVDGLKEWFGQHTVQ